MRIRDRLRLIVQPSALISVRDPVLAAYFGVGAENLSGVTVGETDALGITAVWRAVNLISGTIASLPLRTITETADGRREPSRSFLDNPAGPGSLTPYTWKQIVIAHLLVYGRAPLAYRRNGAGALIGLTPIHPSMVQTMPPETDKDGRLLPKRFTVSLPGGHSVDMVEGRDMTEILGFTMDGWHGMGVLEYHRNALGTHIAGDRAAARMFANGFLASGLVTPEEDVDEDEAKDIKAHLDSKTAGYDHAGEVAFVNRKLKFEKWAMSAEDAQFIASRQFQIEEIARMFGIPPFELMQTEKQTSWGTGIEAQQRGLARGNLLGWTMRVEEHLTRLIGRDKFSEFDFGNLERPTPENEIRLLIEQVREGVMTPNEARRQRNLPDIDGGNELRVFGKEVAPA